MIWVGFCISRIRGPSPRSYRYSRRRGAVLKLERGLSTLGGLRKHVWAFPWKQPKYFQSTHTYMDTKAVNLFPNATSLILNQNMPHWSVVHSSPIVKQFLVALPVRPSSHGKRPSLYPWGKRVSILMHTMEICIYTELTQIESALGRCQGQRQHIHSTALHLLLRFVFCLGNAGHGEPACTTTVAPLPDGNCFPGHLKLW